jgi:hypothetical protein
MSPDSSSNGTEADEPLPLPPSKKARLARQAAMSTVAKTNTVTQFGKQISLVHWIGKKA